MSDSKHDPHGPRRVAVPAGHRAQQVDRLVTPGRSGWGMCAIRQSVRENKACRGEAGLIPREAGRVASLGSQCWMPRPRPRSHELKKKKRGLGRNSDPAGGKRQLVNDSIADRGLAVTNDLLVNTNILFAEEVYREFVSRYRFEPARPRAASGIGPHCLALVSAADVQLPGVGKALSQAASAPASIGLRDGRSRPAVGSRGIAQPTHRCPRGVFV